MSDTVTTAPTPWDYGLDGFWIDEELKDDYKGLPVSDGAPATITLSNGIFLTQFNGERYQDQFGDLWDLIFWDYPEYYTFVIGTPKDYGLLECSVNFAYEYGAGTLPTKITFSKFYSPLSNIVRLKIWFDTPTEDSPDKVVLRYTITNSDDITTVWREVVNLKDWFTEYNNAYFKIIPSSTTFVPPTSEAATIVVGGNYSVSLFNSEDNALVTTYTDTTLSKTANAYFVVFTGYPNPYTSETNPTLTIKYPTTDNTLGSITLDQGTYKATLTTVGLTRTLTLTNSSDEVQTLQWSNSLPAGRTIVGLSSSPDSSSVVIPVGASTSTSITVDGDITLYEASEIVYTTQEIILLQNTADPIVVDKTNYLTKVRSIYGVFRTDVDIVSPSIRITVDTPNFNYVYIDQFKRYYYVTDATRTADGMWEFYLSCDVLMSFKSAILGCTAFVERNEYTTNPDIIDTKIVMEQGQTVTDNVIEPIDGVLLYETTLTNQPALYVLDVYCGYST